MITRIKGPKEPIRCRYRLFVMRDPLHEPEHYESESWDEIVDQVRKSINRDIAIICHEVKKDEFKESNEKRADK